MVQPWILFLWILHQEVRPYKQTVRGPSFNFPAELNNSHSSATVASCLSSLKNGNNNESASFLSMKTINLCIKTTKELPNWIYHAREPPLYFVLPLTMFYWQTSESRTRSGFLFYKSPSHPLGTWNAVNSVFLTILLRKVLRTNSHKSDQAHVRLSFWLTLEPELIRHLPLIYLMRQNFEVARVDR